MSQTQGDSLGTESNHLVMLTQRFPGSGGDSAFISNEINVLASRFQSIDVFSTEPCSDEVPLLPENVRYRGQILGSGRTLLEVIRGTRAVQWPRIMGLLLGETLASGSLRFLPRVFRASVIAVRGGDQLRDHVRALAPTGNVHVYSFWGADCGYVLATRRGEESSRSVRLHRFDLYEEITGHLPFRKRILESCDLVAPISAAGLDYLNQRYPALAAEGRMEVHRLGTKDHGPGPKPSPRSDWVRVVSCSSLIKIKRVDHILESVLKLSAHRRVEWLHFGDGPTRAELDALISVRVNPSLRVQLRGQTPNAALMDFYSTTPVDVFVNLSSSEGVPVSIMEAQSFGIPVVASDVGGTSEVVTSRAGKLGSASAEASTVADVLRQVIDHREKYSPRESWEDISRGDVNAARFAEAILRPPKQRSDRPASGLRQGEE